MAVETIFLVCNYGVIPFWALLCLAPRAKVTDVVVHSPVPALFGAMRRRFSLIEA